MTLTIELERSHSPPDFILSICCLLHSLLRSKRNKNNTWSMHCLIGRICTSVGVDNLRLVIIVMTWTYYCGGGQKQIVVACNIPIWTRVNCIFQLKLICQEEHRREQSESSEFPYESAHICFLFVLILFGLTTSNERQQFYNNRHPSLQGQPSEVSCRSIFPIRFIGATTQCAVEFTPSS